MPILYVPELGGNKTLDLSALVGNTKQTADQF